MNYGEEGTFVLKVKVDIRPMWIKPPQSVSEKMGRAMTETRMEAFADQLASFIGDALRDKSPEEWAAASAKLRQYFIEGERR